MTLCFVDWDLSYTEQDAKQRRSEKWHTLIGGLVVHPHGKIFAQQRSMTRNFGPGLWDNVGGHVEDGEALIDTLRREIFEETGWELKDIDQIFAYRDWHDARGPSREYIVTCSVMGDLDHPKLEVGKVDRFLWIDQGNLLVLNENRQHDQTQIEMYTYVLRKISAS